MTGKSLATCGHEITEKWLRSKRGEITIKAYTQQRHRCLSHLVVCPECKKLYKKVILKTMASRVNWLYEGRK